MKKTISEISEAIHQSQLSETEQNIFSIQKLTRKLNKLLIQTGDLTECAWGKIETKQGLLHGISGEYREPECGKPYWLPLYTAEGYSYVLSLFSEHKTTLIGTTIPAGPVEFRYSRTVWKKMQKKYGNQYRIILLEGPDKYWTFDEDAQRLAHILGADTVATAHGCNITYKKDVHKAIIKALASQTISYLVIHPKHEEAAKFDGIEPSLPVPVYPSDSVDIDVKFRAKETNGTSNDYGNYIISDGLKYAVPKPVERIDGTIEIIIRPPESIDNCIRINPDTPLARVLLGAQLNESRTYNTTIFTIVEFL